MMALDLGGGTPVSRFGDVSVDDHDDEGARGATVNLARSAGLSGRGFVSAIDFLAAHDQKSRAPFTPRARVGKALRVLEQTKWVIAGPDGAAAKLGRKRSTLHFRMKKLGVTRRPTESLAK